MRKNIYLYPNSARGKEAIPNPYIRNMVDSLNKYYRFVNRANPSSIGIFDSIKYFRKTDYFMLHWIENLPDKKNGVAQSFYFIFFLLLIKISGKKLIWTMHNRLSHFISHLILKKLLFKFLVRSSNYIITHSSDGINYLKNLRYKRLEKVKYIPHPIIKKEILQTKTKVYDVLIWGTIIAYKGIDSFLELLKEKNVLDKLKILIIGKAHSNEYFDSLLKYSSNSTIIKNQYIPEEELKELISLSKCVLFPYKEESVLSSGALIDTLCYGATIIGPCSGAFKDLEQESLVTTYKNNEELIDLLVHPDKHKIPDEQKINAFIIENSWENYATKIFNWIN